MESCRPFDTAGGHRPLRAAKKDFWNGSALSPRLPCQPPDRTNVTAIQDAPPDMFFSLANCSGTGPSRFETRRRVRFLLMRLFRGDTVSIRSTYRFDPNTNPIRCCGPRGRTAILQNRRRKRRIRQHPGVAGGTAAGPAPLLDSIRIRICTALRRAAPAPLGDAFPWCRRGFYMKRGRRPGSGSRVRHRPPRRRSSGSCEVLAGGGPFLPPGNFPLLSRRDFGGSQRKAAVCEGR